MSIIKSELDYHDRFTERKGVDNDFETLMSQLSNKDIVIERCTDADSFSDMLKVVFKHLRKYSKLPKVEFSFIIWTDQTI